MTQFWPEGRLIQTASNRQALQNRAALEQAAHGETVVEGLCTRCDPSHCLHVALGDLTGVIPREECALGVREGTARDIVILTCVGRPVSCVVTGFAADGTLLLSRRRAQERALGQLLEAMPGEILPATVTHLEPYGAFVDLGCGVPSLIPIKSISVSRIPHPDRRFRPGQEIYAVVRGVEPERNRILLSHKELLGTWAENVGRFQVGETVTGTVRSVMDYGIFVELAPNLTGLAEPTPNYAAGDRVSVYIKSILPEKRKLKLTLIRHAAPMPDPLPLVYRHTAGRILDWDYTAPVTVLQEDSSPFTRDQ